MDVSVLLVSYNTCLHTINCIRSIYTFTSGVNFEIIVVDNASDDDTVATILDNFKNVKVITSTENLGFGRANNLAATFANGKYLFILNTDTKLQNNAIRYFYDFYENIAPIGTGAIGGILLTPDLKNGWSCNKFNSIGTIIKWYYGRLFDTKRQRQNLVGSRTIEPGEYFYADYVTGADIFIPAELFKRIDGFDPSIFLFYEDEELQYRLHMLGYKNLIVGGAHIIHFEGSSMQNIGGKVSNQKSMIAERSMFYYFRKRYGKSYAILAKLVYLILIALPLRLRYSIKENKEYFLSYIKF